MWVEKTSSAPQRDRMEVSKKTLHGAIKMLTKLPPKCAADTSRDPDPTKGSRTMSPVFTCAWLDMSRESCASILVLPMKCRFFSEWYWMRSRCPSTICKCVHHALVYSINLIQEFCFVRKQLRSLRLLKTIYSHVIYARKKITLVF